MHTTDTKNKIIEFIKQHESASNKQLQALTGITQVGISQHLRELVNQGRIVKFGQHPRHSYHLSLKEQAKVVSEIYEKPEVAAALKEFTKTKSKLL